jgi:probable rRNA maturation factor
MEVAVRGREEPVEWLDTVRDAVTFTLEAEEAPVEAEVGVAFVSEEEMASLNEQYRGIEGPTDVLAFAYAAQTRLEGELELGDIAICGAVAERQAVEVGHSVIDELRVLAVHGALHLLGREHSTDEEAETMEQREREILTALKHDVSGERA